jgi:hypothetical protein
MQSMPRFRLQARSMAAIVHALHAFIKETRMHLHIDHPTLALATGEVLALDDVSGYRIQAASGVVWVTEEGEPRDHIVGPGDAFIVARPGRTLVQALEASMVSIREGDPPANDAAPAPHQRLYRYY